MAHKAALTLPGIMARTAAMAGIWWVITQGRADSWLVGAPAVAVATLASVQLSAHAPSRFSLLGLLRFLAMFVVESVRGGVDVARRTLGYRLRIRPGFRRYRLHLRDPRARVLLVNCISLLPGTLVSNLDGEHMEVHLLDAGEDPEPDLRRLEQAVAGLFGVQAEKRNV
ncbi:MAG: Na+/H+ antiporter subunit E [Thiogranum sp.]|jgi:multicomponent Na+:H+ antiporter subunit E|nr:Na+/H+ antiporter subunit E [Thiogranum sp.]